MIDAIQRSPEYDQYMTEREELIRIHNLEVERLERREKGLELLCEEKTIELSTARNSISYMTKRLLDARMEEREKRVQQREERAEMQAKEKGLRDAIAQLEEDLTKLGNSNVNMLGSLDKAIQRENELKQQIETLEEEHLDKLEVLEDRQEMHNKIRAHIVTRLLEGGTGYNLPRMSGCGDAEVYIDISHIGIGTDMYNTMDELAAQYLEYYANCDPSDVCTVLVYHKTQKATTKAAPKPRTAAKGKPKTPSIRK